MAARDDFESTITRLTQNNPLRSYLVTYSQLDHKIFSTRWSFGGAVVEAFGANNVDYFAASKEAHENPGEYHYHVSVRLCRPMRWMRVKDYLNEKYHVVVNFSTSSAMYIGAYRYATKEDKSPIIKHVLKRHPNLEMVSHTYNRAIVANSTYCENAAKKRMSAAEENPSNSEKRKRITKGDVAMFVVESSVKTELELINLATERRNLGDRALYDYLIAMRKQQREELVQDAWRFENANKIIEDENIDIMKTVDANCEKECICNGMWYRCAKEVLTKNNIEHSIFAEAVVECLTKGRQKHVNILLVGPASCAKTFLLKPVVDLFPNVFMNPASSTFGWMGIEKANLVLLNDIRWKPRGIQGGNIEWGDFLNLLEGLHVSLPAPMNTHCSHLKVNKCMPILATSIAPITYWVKDVSEPQTERHHEENLMMSERWNTFTFTHQIKKADKVIVPNCTVCFSKFILQK